MKKIIYILVFVLSTTSLQAQFTLQAGVGYSNYQWHQVTGAGAMQILGANTSSYAPSAPGVFYATFDGTDCGRNATEYYVFTVNGDTNIVLNGNQNNSTYQWYQDNNQISGATNSSLNVTATDSLVYYQAEINDGNCNKQLPGFYVYHQPIWAPLPIELLNFTARLSRDEERVLLNWKTETEINSDYFTVERSINRLDWEYVSQTNAAGNSTNLLSYNSVDEAPYKGESFYRLKTTDLDNSFVYSPVRRIYRGEKQISYLRAYPNPFSDKIILEGPVEELEAFKIYNSIGRVVRSINLELNQLTKVEIDVSDLAQGVYFIRTQQSQLKLLKKE
jgi:hypothetical protein